MGKHIVLLPGDGIGVEVLEQAERLLQFLDKDLRLGLTFEHALLGGIAYDKTGTPFPDATKEAAKKADAVLLGAVGGPKWEGLDYAVRPERGLLGIRKELGLFANLRPAIVFDELAEASSLKKELVAGLDIMIIRELTGDLYFGEPRGVTTLANGERKGVNTMMYTTSEIARIARVAFEIARKRNKKLCSIDKANVLECTELWREEVTKIGKTEYPDVALSHMYVDNAAMQLVRNPKQFDVMLTGNMFGDILSDEASMLTGSLGMLPSASLGAPESKHCHALYEPIHGSAPDIAGKGLANPIATILSVAMMFKYSFDMPSISEHIEQSVKEVLQSGYRTGDIMQDGANKVGTKGMGDAIIETLTKRVKKAA